MYMCGCMPVHVLEWVGGVKICLIAILKCVTKYARVSIQCILNVVVLVYDNRCVRVC